MPPQLEAGHRLVHGTRHVMPVEILEPDTSEVVAPRAPRRHDRHAACDSGAPVPVPELVPSAVLQLKASQYLPGTACDIVPIEKFEC